MKNLEKKIGKIKRNHGLIGAHDPMQTSPDDLRRLSSNLKLRAKGLRKIAKLREKALRKAQKIVASGTNVSERLEALGVTVAEVNALRN